MKRVYLILISLAIAYASLGQAKDGPAGPDKVICNGNAVTIGMEDDPKLCYSWKASPADPAIVNAKTSKITVSPKQTTVYTLTMIGEEFTKVTSDDVKVTVTDASKAVIEFLESPNQNFGFDKVTGSNDVYLSIDKDGTTKVNVKLTPFVADAYCVTSSDPVKLKVPDDSVLLTSETTEIEMTGQNKGGDHESVLLEVRCGDKKGAVLKTLHVELYKKLSIAKITYYRIKDGTVPATTPAKNLTFDQLKTALNNIYKQGVIEVQAVDGDRDKDLRYDLNNNGFLDFYNDGANPEKAVIEGAGLAGNPKIAYVEKMRDNWRLSAAIAVGDKDIKVVNAGGLAPGPYTIGAPIGAGEVVNIQSVNTATNTVTLSSGVTSAHAITHTLYGGLAGLSTNPQLVTDADGELVETIVHEILHNAVFGNLLDVGETDNVMYYTTGGAGGLRKLRYREQTVVGTGTGVPTGAKQKQWDIISR